MTTLCGPIGFRRRRSGPHSGPYKLGTLDGTKMPPLGHDRVDPQGVQILREWIASLPGPPTIAPRGGDSEDPVRVTIAHPDPAAIVRYTLDGSPPGPSSPAYGGPLGINRSATVRARAFKPGHTRSIVVQDTFGIGD